MSWYDNLFGVYLCVSPLCHLRISIVHVTSCEFVLHVLLTASTVCLLKASTLTMYLSKQWPPTVYQIVLKVWIWLNHCSTSRPIDWSLWSWESKLVLAHQFSKIRTLMGGAHLTPVPHSIWILWAESICCSEWLKWDGHRSGNQISRDDTIASIATKQRRWTHMSFTTDHSHISFISPKWLHDHTDN